MSLFVSNSPGPQNIASCGNQAPENMFSFFTNTKYKFGRQNRVARLSADLTMRTEIADGILSHPVISTDGIGQTRWDFP